MTPAASPKPDTARPSRRAVLIAFGGAAAATTLTPASVAAAPKSRLLDGKWRKTGSAVAPSVAPYERFLAAHAQVGGDGIVRLDYRAASANRADLTAWLATAVSTDPTTLSRDEAFVHWVNIYNAKTIDLVLEDYPVGSIKEVRGGLFNTGPWGDKVVTVNGDRLSLDDIEHGILRPIWGDARVHYAVNCAALGCPNLKPTPWIAATLEADLEAGARAYVNHPRGARVEGGRLTVSKIYDWFQEDFGGNDAGVIAHLTRYAEPGLAASLAGLTRIDDTEYDWDLNTV